MPDPLSDLALRHLAKVVESSDDAIVSKDLNSTIISWNKAAERMFGYPAEEAVGRSIRMIIPADRQNEEDEVLAKIRVGESVTHYETIRQRRDGSLFPVSLTVSPVYDDHGRVIAASKIARDVSERHAADQAIRQHAHDAHRLGQIGALVASTLDRDTIIQKVTDAAVELTHAKYGAFFYNARSPETGESQTLYAVSGAAREAFEWFPPPRSTVLFGPAYYGPGPVRIADVTADTRYIAPVVADGVTDGGAPVRSYLAVPVRGWGGELIGGLLFGHPEVGCFNEQHERLASGVAGWAALALENAQLFVEARNANRMKDEFLAVLSHELRTPLNAIVGYSRLLRGGMLPPDKAERGLETLERNAKWLTQIVEDVLDVSRIVSGKIRLDVQPVDLAPIIGNSVATVQPAADARGVRLETSLDSRVGRVSGDPDRLQQVIWNLLSNAVKFTPRDGRVEIKLAAAHGHAEITVSDTGSGIATDFLPYVFDRFRQADSGTTRRTGGLGLGLAIVRHLVEMHGGTASASSAGEGHGSTFRVVLPLMGAGRARIDERREEIGVAELTPLAVLSGLTGVRVLAIDDEPDALALLRAVLETAGAEVTTTVSPRQVLEQIATVAPHVLIADVGMPEMDGFELIARIRASPNPDVRDVPAAALTAFARSEDRTKALRSGFELHLSKPIDPGELVAAVARLARRAYRPV